jgi:2-polyprenyl-3-methyl-5-hydroxy-6-metoxy-1,4-benzoquinol methylase
VSLLMRIADNQSERSAAHRMRRRRFQLFLSLLERVSRPVSILDVGGSPAFWRSMGFVAREDAAITLLNIDVLPDESGFEIVTGDARAMSEFRDGQFDVVFSNSTIEHVGTWQDQERAAAEMRRVGQRYFVQTPNRYFLIEPHFLIPGFQFLPLTVRANLLTRMRLGWVPRARNYDSARRTVEQIRLLTRREMMALFPGASLHVERFAGLAKSFVCYNGW